LQIWNASKVPFVNVWNDDDDNNNNNFYFVSIDDNWTGRYNIIFMYVLKSGVSVRMRAKSYSKHIMIYFYLMMSRDTRVRSLLNVHKPVGGFKYIYIYISTNSTKFLVVFRLMEVLTIILSKFIYLFIIWARSIKNYIGIFTKYVRFYFILADYFSIIFIEYFISVRPKLLR